MGWILAKFLVVWQMTRISPRLVGIPTCFWCLITTGWYPMRHCCEDVNSWRMGGTCHSEFAGGHCNVQQADIKLTFGISSTLQRNHRSKYCEYKPTFNSGLQFWLVAPKLIAVNATSWIRTHHKLQLKQATVYLQTAACHGVWKQYKLFHFHILKWFLNICTTWKKRKTLLQFV